MTKDRFICVTSGTLLLLSVLSVAAAQESSPATTMYPMMDQFLAINADTNATFNCSVALGFVVIWEVGGTQISYSAQFTNFRNMGYTIQPASAQSAFSTITVSVRDLNKVSVIKCLPFVNSMRWCPGCSDLEPDYSVITFDSPEVPVDLTLQPSLMLQWSRPLNVPSEVPISYTIESNATDGSGMNFRNFTSETSFSVQFLEDLLRDLGSECMEFEFFVFASNDAGSSPLARLKDTVPISPDVTNVSNELKVERVSLQHQLQTASVDISFPSVDTCSDRFPLSNYTINLNKEVYHVLAQQNVTSGSPTLSTTLNDLPQDKSFSLTITPCNEVTCRTSEPRLINTTDVQRAEVVFYENDLYLHCTFADNSKATGCVFELVLKNSNRTERFNVTRQSGKLYTTANNQREFYSSVLVVDWEENGMVGNVTLDITSIVRNVSSLAEFTELTGFREASVSDGIHLTTILPAVLSTLLVAVVLIAGIFLIVYCKQRKTIKNSSITKTERVDDNNTVLEVTFKDQGKVTELLKPAPSKRPKSCTVNGNDDTDSPDGPGTAEQHSDQHPPPVRRSLSAPEHSVHNTMPMNYSTLERSVSNPEKSMRCNTDQEPVGILELSKNSIRVNLLRLRAIKKGGEYPFLLRVSDDFEALLSANSESEENGESKASTTGAAVDSEAQHGECQQTQVDMDCNDSLTKTSGRSELVQQEVHVSSV